MWEITNLNMNREIIKEYGKSSKTKQSDIEASDTLNIIRKEQD